MVWGFGGLHGDWCSVADGPQETFMSPAANGQLEPIQVEKFVIIE